MLVIFPQKYCVLCELLRVKIFELVTPFGLRFLIYRTGFTADKARGHIKILEGAKPLAMKFTRQGNNDWEVLYLKYRGCKAKRQRVQWDPHTAQSHPVHPPGYGPAADELQRKLLLVIALVIATC